MKSISKNRKIVYLSYMTFIETIGMILYFFEPIFLSICVIIGMNLCAIAWIVVDYSEICEEVTSIGV